MTFVHWKKNKILFFSNQNFFFVSFFAFLPCCFLLFLFLHFLRILYQNINVQFFSKFQGTKLFKILFSKIFLQIFLVFFNIFLDQFYCQGRLSDAKNSDRKKSIIFCRQIWTKCEKNFDLWKKSEKFFGF